jgi:REP element-mobilizing transposase RayT
MTAPRQVLPGATYLVTRRCAQRQLLLRPSPRTNAIFLFVLAVAARRFNVRIHAFCVLSNHFHLVLTDPDARLPAFEQYLDSLVARAMNASLGRWESFWAPSSYSAVALTSPQDIVAKTVYVLANPAAAGLVRSGREWPGLWSAPEHIGRAPLVAKRPDTFFSATGSMPESAALALEAPAGFASAEEFRRLIVDGLACAERDALGAEPGLAHERAVLGPRRVLAQSPFARASDPEARRALRPRVAARDKWKRIEVLGRLVAFLDGYRVALRERRAGRRDVVFPAGTYLLRVAHGVPCAAVA